MSVANGRVAYAVLVCTALSVAGELLIFATFSIWSWCMYGGNLFARALWSVGFCGLAMGALLGLVTGGYIARHWIRRAARNRTVFASFLLLGIGCNSLCFAIDRQLNWLGAPDYPIGWLVRGILLSLFGGWIAGWLLFLNPDTAIPEIENQNRIPEQT